jgi:hypothetical protein
MLYAKGYHKAHHGQNPKFLIIKAIAYSDRPATT